MQFRDLKAQYQVLKDKIDTAMIKVATDGNFIIGNQVLELEKDLAEYVGVKHCISCANGTDALTMALMAWGIKKGDAVFIPDFTFFATGEVASLQGATPIFVDVDKDTFNIDVNSLEKAILKTIEKGELSPKVIIGVDLFGLPADYIALRKLADKYNLFLLEDGAQGFGGEINGKRACSFGDISTTSFFPAKPLGCYGDGGALFTDNDEVAEYLMSIRHHGKGLYKYDNVRIGLNSRLDTIQAAILQPKFEAFKEYEVKAVNEVALQYTNLLKDLVKTPIVPQGYYSSWAQYTIQLKSKEERDGLQEFLKQNNIPSMVYYPKPMHLQTAFADLKSVNESFEITQTLVDTVLSLPMHPYLKQDEIELVTTKIREYLK